MSKGKKLLIENIEKEIEKLKQDFQSVSNKKLYTSNPEEENNLQLQLDDIIRRIDEKDIYQRKIITELEENSIQSLLEILTELVDIKPGNLTHIKGAYRACYPPGWIEIRTDDLEKILADIEVMPQGNSKYRRIEHFVAYLTASITDSLPLGKWVKENINDFSELFNQEKNRFKQSRKHKESYLLILFEKSNQESTRNKSNYYHVKASAIPDIHIYDYENGCGFQPVDVPEINDKPISIDDIPEVLNTFINTSIISNLRNLTIEIFVPLELLNHNLDCCELKDELDLGFSTPTLIGQDYKIVIRSYERWTKAYNRLRVFWEDKWDKLQLLTDTSACAHFIEGNETHVDKLIPQLKSSDAVGLKVANAPTKIGKGSILAAILQTAIPAALWLRKNPSGVDCQSEIDQILNCCVCKLPEAVKNRRGLANPNNVDTEISHHISLLWEDPYRLPPSIDYSM